MNRSSRLPPNRCRPLRRPAVETEGFRGLGSGTFHGISTGTMLYSRRRFTLAGSFLFVMVLLVPTIVLAQVNVVGQWSILPNQSPINPIHVSLLPTGKVLIASGTENDPTHTVSRGAVYDPRTGTFNVQNIDWTSSATRCPICPTAAS